MEQLVRSINQVSNVVRRRRKTLGLTQNQLSETLGIRQATISNLEAGDSGARLKTLLDVVTALGLELVVRERTKAPNIEDIF